MKYHIIKMAKLSSYLSTYQLTVVVLFLLLPAIIHSFNATSNTSSAAKAQPTPPTAFRNNNANNAADDEDSDDPGAPSSPDITETASEEDFPYQAAVFFASTGRHICSGTIIAPRRVLTAAHCVTSSELIIHAPRILAVMAGSRVRSDLPDANRTIRRVQQIRVHPEFFRSAPHHDVAVLTLSRHDLTLRPPPLPHDKKVGMLSRTPAVGHRYMAAVPLSGRNSDKLVVSQRRRHQYSMAPGNDTALLECVVSGWAETTWTDAPDLLKYTFVQPIPNAECVRRMGNAAYLIGHDTLCAIGANHEDAASGDSGGPLVCNGQLFGVVSFAPRAKRSGVPGIYARISHEVVDWIRTDQADSESGAEPVGARRHGGKWIIVVAVAVGFGSMLDSVWLLWGT